MQGWLDLCSPGCSVGTSLSCSSSQPLTNLATSIHCKTLIELGCIPVLISLLDSPHEHVRGQAVWALGNFAGDSPACLDFLLQSGVLPFLLAASQQHAKTASWAISNLCRGKPPPPYQCPAQCQLSVSC